MHWDLFWPEPSLKQLEQPNCAAQIGFSAIAEFAAIAAQQIASLHFVLWSREQFWPLLP